MRKRAWATALIVNGLWLLIVSVLVLAQTPPIEPTATATVMPTPREEPQTRGPHETELDGIADPQTRKARHVEIAASYFVSPTIFVDQNRTFNLAAVQTVVNGDNLGLRWLVEVSDSNGMVFRDFVQIWNRPPLLEYDGNFHLAEDGTTRIPNTREAPDDAIRSVLISIVNQLTESGAFLPANPGTVSVFYSNTNDKIHSSDHVNWESTQNGTTLITDTITNQYNLAVNESGSDYQIRQVYFEFDTSALPDEDLISDVDISFTSSGGKEDDLIATIELREYTWIEGSSTADWIDVSVATNWTNLLLAASITLNEWVGSNLAGNILSTESELLDMIDVSGSVLFALGLDVMTGSAPPNESTSDFNVYTANQTGTTSDPRLTVVHSEPPPPTPTPTPTPVLPPVMITPPILSTDDAISTALLIAIFVLFAALGYYVRVGLFWILAIVPALSIAFVWDDTIWYLIWGIVSGLCVVASWKHSGPRPEKRFETNEQNRRER
jgi:hypothetical protein